MVGAVGTEGEGLTGLEQSEQDVLGGEDGDQEITRDAAGDADPARDRAARPAPARTSGSPSTPRSRRATEEALAAAGETYGAKGATAIVMNPADGDVYAIANWPPATTPTTSAPPPRPSCMNRATGFTYEPGSTFKAFTVAAALEEGIVTPGTTFDLPRRSRSPTG